MSGIEIAEEIRNSRLRLQRMKDAAADLDRRIDRLERAKNHAPKGEQPRLGLEIQSLTSQRTATQELVQEAEAQLTARQEALQGAAEQARRDLGKIGETCADAARRFDTALREALGCLVEIEQAAEPLQGAGCWPVG